ncbi:hypothetical protein ACPC54_26205 [Kitasatospora sp. NPDC094028]
MSGTSAVVWRGLGYGVGAAVGLGTVVLLAVAALTFPEQPAGAFATLLYWPVFAVFGAVNGALPGVAVGAVLARTRDRDLEWDRVWTARGRAALAAGGTYFAQVMALAVATDGKGWTPAAAVGAVFAALLAALCARRVVGRAAAPAVAVELGRTGFRAGFRTGF